MPKPRFIECGFCGRMFTVHSVEVHESRCTENPQAAPDASKRSSVVLPKDNMPQPTIEPATSQKKPIWMIWARNGGKERPEGKSSSSPAIATGTAAATAAAVATTHPARPATMTLSSSQSDNVIRGPQTRVCFVCGQRFSERSLEIHEKKCIQLWQLQKKALPATVKCKEPQKLRIPSVDGTRDVGRIDAVAHISSSQAQRVECTKCRSNIALGDAKQHAENCRGGQRKGAKKQKNNPWRNKDDALYAVMY